MKPSNPNSRFKEFDVNWSMLPASGIFMVETDKGHPELPVLSASQELGMVKRDNIGINMQYSKQNIASYKRVLPGRFVIHLRSFQGGFAHSAIEGITSPAYTVLSLKESQKHDDYFWKYLFTSPEFIKRLELVTYGIRDGRSISVEDFFELPFCFPSTPEEQYKIAQFFSRLDTLIAAEDKKLAKLKNMKTASLEKMFPKAGETTPQVRFKGFKGEWMYKALKEIASNFEYGINAPAKSFDGINKYLRITDIDDDLRTFDKTNLTSPDAQDIQSFLLQEGDIVFARTGASVGKSYLYDTKDGVVVYAGYLIKARLDESVCHRFILYATLSARFSNFIRITSQRSGQPGVNSKEYGEYMFQIPPTKEEQIIIADFFSRLDTLISAQEQKLDKLRSLKKSFLEKMFVSTK